MTAADFSAKWDIRFADNTTFLIDEADFREFKDDLLLVFGLAGVNVPVYVPGATYTAGYLVRYSALGGKDRFYYSLTAGQLSAPGPGNLVDWKEVLGPVAATALWQPISLVVAQGLDGAGVQAGRLYQIDMGLNQAGKQQYVYLMGLDQFFDTTRGVLEVDGTRTAIVDIDVAAGTWEPANQQEAETITYADLLAELTNAGVVRQKWFRITQRTNGQPDITVYFTNPGDPSGFGDDATAHLQPNGQTTLNRWAKYSLSTDEFAYDTSLNENEYVRGDANGNIIVGTQAASHSIGGQQNLITGGEDNHIVGGNCNTIAGGSGNQIDGGDFNAITNSFGSSIPASCTYVQLINCQAFVAPANATDVTYINNQLAGTGSAIPLAGTAPGANVTGDVVLDDNVALEFTSGGGNFKFYGDGGQVSIVSVNTGHLVALIKETGLELLDTSLKLTITGNPLVSAELSADANGNLLVNGQPVGATYTDTDAAAAAAAALVAGNAQHQGIQASLNAGQVVLTVQPAKEDIVSVFPVNTISTGELPIVYTKWTGTYQNYSTQNVTQLDIKVNGAAAVFPLTLMLGDVLRIVATVGGTGTGLVTLLHA